ncbi:hypothetical protein ES288_A06G122900v1 [Gossypium darwinii]|uniref:Secreted protein n=1 Tax=Gossypium darwinii TaxID=34276 RepID=A0A5D2G4P0_GOSDA|nr:hypothetical protein ES288_A06G122900v1 [Gossypium darwinii]
MTVHVLVLFIWKKLANHCFHTCLVFDCEESIPTSYRIYFMNPQSRKMCSTVSSPNKQTRHSALFLSLRNLRILSVGIKLLTTLHRCILILLKIGRFQIFE